MNRVLCWFLVLGLFAVFGMVTARVLQARIDAGTGMPPFSVYARDDDALAECARLLHRLGWEPVALTRPVQPARHRGLLILVEPELSSLLPLEPPDLPEHEVKALLGWVARGNTLLLCGRKMTGLHRALDVVVTVDRTVGPGTVQSVEVAEAGAYTDGVGRLMIEGRETLRAPAGLPLWELGDGQPGAVLLRWGNGRVLVVADPSLLTLRGLRRADNGRFLYNVAALHARDGRVYFDEYHHGLQSGGGFWGYLRHHGQQAALVPVLLVALAAAWSVAVRLGPAVPRRCASRADAVDYASSLARIYQRSGARRLLARAVARDFLAALTGHLRLRRTALPIELLAAWRQRHPGASANQLQALLRGLAELRKGDLSERQLLAWVQAFDAFLAEVRSAR